MIKVRNAHLGDLPWLLEQLAIFGKSYPGIHCLWPYDHPEHAEAVAQNLVENHLCLLAVRSGEPIGFIAAALGPHPFNPAIRTLVVLAWWVVVEARSTSAGALLFDRFFEYGKEHADWIVANTVTGLTDVRAATFEKRGFHLHEQSYLFEVPRKEQRQLRSA